MVCDDTSIRFALWLMSEVFQNNNVECTTRIHLNIFAVSKLFLIRWQVDDFYQMLRERLTGVVLFTITLLLSILGNKKTYAVIIHLQPQSCCCFTGKRFNMLIVLCWGQLHIRSKHRRLVFYPPFLFFCFFRWWFGEWQLKACFWYKEPCYWSYRRQRSFLAFMLWEWNHRYFSAFSTRANVNDLHGVCPCWLRLFGLFFFGTMPIEFSAF